MTTYQMTATRATITVHASQERAFRAFTEEYDRWWPAEHHLGKDDFAEVVVEPHAGGRWFERAADGTECDWGQVLVHEPFTRVVFGWHINGDWAYDPDPAHASEVEVTFVPEGADRTRVELTHGKFERHAVKPESVRDGVSTDNGWQGGLRRFAAYVNG